MQIDGSAETYLAYAELIRDVDNISKNLATQGFQNSDSYSDIANDTLCHVQYVLNEFFPKDEFICFCIKTGRCAGIIQL